MDKSVFETLNAINCNEHIEQKNGLTYLSWAWAWGIAKKHYPNATYKVYENNEGWNYFTDGRTCWVKTGVTIKDEELIEMLPVMDFRNASIPLEKVTSFDVNKAIQRSLTKALARHGLGLYIYAGEDLPDAETVEKEEVKEEPKKAAPVKKAKPKKAEEPKEMNAEDYWKVIKAKAEGRLTRTGGDYKETWMKMYSPTPEMVAKFDHDVENYKLANL